MHLNAVKDFIIKDCDICNNFLKVPVRATLSAANFNKPFINAIADASGDTTMSYGEMRDMSYAYYRDRFKESVDITFDNVYKELNNQSNEKWKDSDPSYGFWHKLFAMNSAGQVRYNTGEDVKVTDGVAYGIVCNGWGVAVNEFPQKFPRHTDAYGTTYNRNSENMYIINTNISNIISNAEETPGVSPPLSDISANYALTTDANHSFHHVLTHGPNGAIISPFTSATKYTNNGYVEEFLNIRSSLNPSNPSTIEYITPDIPFMEPRVENWDISLIDPSSVHFNTLFAIQTIIGKEKSTIWNLYPYSIKTMVTYDTSLEIQNNFPPTPDGLFNIAEISGAVHSKALDVWLDGSYVDATAPPDPSFGNGDTNVSNAWIYPYCSPSGGVEINISKRNYKNTFRTSFHYLTGMANIGHAHRDIGAGNPWKDGLDGANSPNINRAFGNNSDIFWNESEDSGPANIKMTAGHDFMAHIAKPVIGMKLDGVSGCLVDTVQLDNVCQFGRHGSNWDCKYLFGQPKFGNRLTGYTGAMATGITLSSSKNIALRDISLNYLHSSYSSVIGINSMWEASNNKIQNVDVKEPVSGVHYWNGKRYFVNKSIYKSNPTVTPSIILYNMSASGEHPYCLNNSCSYEEFEDISKTKGAIDCSYYNINPPNNFGFTCDPTYFKKSNIILANTSTVPPNNFTHLPPKP